VVVSRLSPGQPTAPASTVCGSGSDPALSYEPPSSTFPGALTHDPAASGRALWSPTPEYQPRPTPRPWTTSAPATGTERGWAMAAHLSGPLAALFALGFLGPLAVLVLAGRRSAFVRRHAVEALNFNLTALVAAVVSALAVLLLVGIPLLVVVAIGYLVGSIAGAVAAHAGAEFRHRFSVPFVR
jgi:uncharacterized protein